MLLASFAAAGLEDLIGEINATGSTEASAIGAFRRKEGEEEEEGAHTSELSLKEFAPASIGRCRCR